MSETAVIPVNPLRPATFADFIGNEAVRLQAEDLVSVAKAEGQPIKHVLLDGAPGMGKTTLARVMAAEYGSRCWSFSGATADDVTDFCECLLELEAGDVVFIDEIHAMPRRVGEAWYSLMEDRWFDAPRRSFLYHGEEYIPKSGWVPPFTLIGATTSPGLMPKPLLDRFEMTLTVQAYTVTELAEILRRAADRMGEPIPAEVAHEIARRSKDTPRTALKLLGWSLVRAKARGQLLLDLAATQEALERRQIDEHGMDPTDRAYLRILAEARRPQGLITLCGRLSLDARTVEWVVEPFFLRRGLSDKSPRGRVITPNGREIYFARSNHETAARHLGCPPAADMPQSAGV